MRSRCDRQPVLQVFDFAQDDPKRQGGGGAAPSAEGAAMGMKQVPHGAVAQQRVALALQGDGAE